VPLSIPYFTDETTQQHFQSLQQAWCWCTQPPVFPRLEDDVPHYGFILYCREIGQDNVSGDIPINAVPAELQVILDAVPSPQQS